jgi:hypothetical protein
MKIEYTKEDFKKGVRNPYFEKLCTTVEVAVRHEDYALFKEIAESYDVTPEHMMQSYLRQHADLLREDYDDKFF